LSDAFYNGIAATASDLITRFGRDVTFVAKRTTEPASEPWKANTGGETTIALKGAFAPPNTVRQFGVTSLGLGTEFENMLQKSEQIIIVNSGDNDMRDYHVARDGGIDWGIIGIQQLKPGNVGILSFVLVRR